MRGTTMTSIFRFCSERKIMNRFVVTWYLLLIQQFGIGGRSRKLLQTAHKDGFKADATIYDHT
jgi:hypothetical protein